MRISKMMYLMPITLVFSGCFTKKSGEAEADQTFSVIKTDYRSVELSKDYVAEVKGIQFVEIRSKMDGFLEKIWVDEGQTVKKGDILFKINSVELQGELLESEAAMKQAQAKLKIAEVELNKIQSLVDKKIMADIRLEQANADYEVAQFELQQTKAKLDRNRALLAYTNITAPYNGIVDKINFKQGSLITVQDLLTTISDNSQIYAYFKINETNYLELKRGTGKGKITDSFNDVDLILSDGSTYNHKGKVEVAGGEFERSTGSITLRAKFPNPDGLLKHGITGNVRVYDTMESVFVIPQRSTFEIQENTYVYMLNESGVVSAKSFRPIARFDNYYVAADFAPSDMIVYEGVQLIKEGSKIICDTISVNYPVNVK